MSDREDGHKSTLTSSQRARRIFIQRAALASAGASAAGTLPAVVRSAAPGPTEAPDRSCPEVKIPMREVEGKVAFITGGSSGIGLGIARAFTDAGMKVVIGYRTKKHLEQAMRDLEKAGDRVHAISVDVTDRPGMEKAAEETAKVFGKLHVLVNNAAVWHPARLSRISYSDWEWVMDVNLNGVFNGVRTFLPRIQAHGEGGQIISSSSMVGLYVGGSSQAAYTVSRFAVVAMMESLRAELSDTNIGVSVFCPGVVRSNITDWKRNRPVNGPSADSNEEAETAAALATAMKNTDIAMDPSEAGRLVLRGMRNNDLYILTHPQYEQIIRDRSEALLASLPRSSNSAETSTTRAMSHRWASIYSAERDRKLCAHVGDVVDRD